MAYSENQLQQFMDATSGAPATQLKMLLYRADRDNGFNTDEQWASVCEFATRKDEEIGGSNTFAERYGKILDAGEYERFASALIADMKDNFIFAAMLAHRGGVDRDLPLIPAAAFNKHYYQGVMGEFALVRFLEWSGFDVSAADADGMTALHYFASVKYPPGSIPSAVSWLIDHGADVDARNLNGDTALTYLCAVEGWSEHHTRSFEALAIGGSDLFHKSADGVTPLSLLKQLNQIEFHPERQEIIEKIEKIADALLTKTRNDASAGAEAQNDAGARSAAPAVSPGTRADSSNPIRGDEPGSPIAPLTPTPPSVLDGEPLSATPSHAQDAMPAGEESKPANREVTFFQDLVKKYITRR